MENMQREGYYTGWQYDNPSDRKYSHRVYYNDIDIATGNLLCDGKVVGNVKMVNRAMNEIDKRNNYMW